jgi:DNA helicase-2/ATP-dependent DNA helicase PcrA
VFLMGLEDGVFPHLRSIGEPDELEEERRLAYVGITRAMERLYLTNAWSRTLYGSTQYNPASRFLEEIPTELTAEAEGSRSKRRKSSFGSSWLESEPRRGSESHRDAVVDAAVRAGRHTEPSGDVPQLKIGDDVRHKKYGEGVVLDMSGAGDKAEVTVRFPGEGEKVLLLSWAPLEKV